MIDNSTRLSLAAMISPKTIAPAIFVSHCLLIIPIAWQSSPNCDEIAHLASGLYHWQTGRFDTFRVNPPLVRLWCAIPLAMSHPQVEWQASAVSHARRPEWLLASELLRVRTPSQIRVDLFLARLMCLPLVGLGGLGCYRWSERRYGPFAALAALSCWCFSPNVLSWGATIGPDIPAASAGVVTCYAVSRWLADPDWLTAFGVGFLLGFTLLTKATWIILLFLLPCIMTTQCLASAMTSARHVPVQAAFVMATSLVTLNLGYGFEGTLTPLRDFEFCSRCLTSVEPAMRDNRFRNSSWGRIPLPLPRAYVEGIDLQRSEFERKKWSYLCGRWKRGGWWYYYVFAALIKTPIGLWMMLLQSAWFPASRLGFVKRREMQRTSTVCTLCLVLPIGCLTVLVSSQTGFSRHFRYAFPCLPFIYIWASQAAAWIEVRSPLRHSALIAMSWFMISSLLCWPLNHAYFNELVGGPRGGHRFLLDANVDWGEDLLYAEAWAKRHPDARPLYRVFVHDEFASHRRFDWRPATDLRSGWYLVSIHRLLDLSDPFSCFQRLTPVARIGFSTLVYRITKTDLLRLNAAGTPTQLSLAQ